MDLSLKAFNSFDGTKISYSDIGQGRPVILLHAFIIDSILNWHETAIAEQIRSMGRRVICPDFRGHGNSDKPHDANAYSDQAMARDIIELLDFLELEHVDLVGYSMGSAVAIQVAVRDTRIDSLVLGGTGTGEWSEWDAENRREEIESLRDAAPADPGFYRQIVDSEEGDRLAVAARLEGDQFPQFTRETVESVEIPVCVINGRDDMESPQVLASVFPHGTSKTCEGDHISAIWSPDFAEAIVGALNWAAHGNPCTSC